VPPVPVPDAVICVPLATPEPLIVWPGPKAPDGVEVTVNVVPEIDPVSGIAFSPAVFQFAQPSEAAGRRPVAGSEPGAPLVPLVFRDAEHEAVAPPLLPAQLHDQGPLPLTVAAAPTVQRLAAGALVRLAPFEEPHAPFTGCAEASLFAEQVAVVPPLLPAQLHAHGPPPLRIDAVPAVQRLAVGALLSVPPFEEPHKPLTAVGEVLPPEEGVNVAYRDQFAGVQIAGEALNLLGRLPKL
jgi:hypothetical protein